MYAITWDSLRPEVQAELREVNPGWVKTVTNICGTPILEIEENEQYLFKEACECIREYYRLEFGKVDCTIVDYSRIPLAYTVDEYCGDNDKTVTYTVQVCADLVNMRIVSVFTFHDLNCEKVDDNAYDNMREMLNDLSCMTFDSLVEMPDWIYRWLELQIEEE